MSVVCPTDFSECADAAQAVAERLARRLGAELVLLHVAVEAPLYHEGWKPAAQVRQVFETQRQWARETLDERAKAIRETGVPARGVVVDGVAHRAIVAEAASQNVRLSKLVDRIRDRVAATVPDVEIVGDPVERLPHLVTFSCLYVDGEALLHALDRAGFAVSSGSSCTSSTLRPSHVLEAMIRDIRFSN